MVDRGRRILQITSTLAGPFGGPALGARHLRSSFADAGFEANIVSTALARPSGGKLNLKQRRELSDPSLPPIIWLEPTAPLALEAAKHAFRVLLREVRRANYVHIHGQHRWVHAAAGLALSIFPRPYGIQFHGSLEPFQTTQRATRKGAFDAAVGDRLRRNAAYVLFASSEEAARATGIRPEQELVVPLGAALHRDGLSDAMASVDAILPGVGRRVLFLGRLAAKKQPDILIQAWARSNPPKDARLVIAGPDGDWTAAALQSLAAQLGVSSSVRILGEVNGSYKTALLERCETFILPSLNENFGVAVGEALLAGAYCILGEDVAAKQHVRAANSGEIVDARDVDQLASAITRRLGHLGSSEADRRARSQAYARNHLTWENVATQIAARFDSKSLTGQ